MNSRFDILGLGCAAVDEFLYVESFPAPDAKVRVLKRDRHAGGLTATALLAAARLGAKCAYAGVLGEDEKSQFLLDTMEREGVDTRQAVRRNGAGPIESVIVLDERHGTRNVFYDDSQMFGADENRPAAEFIRRARVLLVDNFGLPGMIRATEIARTNKIPVVADFESNEGPRFEELLAAVDHLILSAEFASRVAKAADARSAAKTLWDANRTAVIVTCGADGCFAMHGSTSLPEHYPAFAVDVIDTTGCGDVFHGAYAVGLARGMNLKERIRFSSAAAALKAGRHGAEFGLPTLSAVEEFLAARS